MCLKRLKRLRHTTGVRLTMWYTGLCLLQTLVLGILTHVLLASSLPQRDHAHIAMELQEIVALYAHSGPAGVQQEVDSYGHPSYYFVRLTSVARATLVLGLPAHWTPSTLPALDLGAPAQRSHWDTIATEDPTTG